MTDNEQRLAHVAELTEAELHEATSLLAQAHAQFEEAELYALQGSAMFELAMERFKAARRSLWLAIALLLLAIAVLVIRT